MSILHIHNDTSADTKFDTKLTHLVTEAESNKIEREMIKGYMKLLSAHQNTKEEY
ncbi:hypothetical protein [Shouchella clausii]|uniref:hypothetical protein n=1 Tax=Shouchella clausii TaxID=79880 RepID=UPI001C736FC4|nr:hypothetical protein [Shouchella clausii]MBX0320122.1 hypothetical protein [Shouchella clausii]